MTDGYDGKVMTYDAENRPLSVTKGGVTTSYVYAADGSRLKKIVNDGQGPVETLYFGPVEVRNFGDGSSEEIITYPHPDIRLVNGVAEAMHRDQLSSVRAITDANGAKISHSAYKPFGEITASFTALGTQEETKGYVGERFDADAGLQYLNARYYDPALGIFVQPDWWEVTQAGVGTNRYSYSLNDPINNYDPKGNQAEPGIIERAVESLFNAGKELIDRIFDRDRWTRGNVQNAANSVVPGLGAYNRSVEHASNGEYADAAIAATESGIEVGLSVLGARLGTAGALAPGHSATESLAARAGFLDNGTPVILDENLIARGTAEALREAGYNVRSVREIFGNGEVADATIKEFADDIGAVVLTRDRGRDLTGGFFERAVTVDRRVRQPSTMVRVLEDQGVVPSTAR